MATLVNRDDIECHSKLTLVKPEAIKQIRESRPKVNHSKEAQRIKKIFRDNGIEVNRVNNL